MALIHWRDVNPWGRSSRNGSLFAGVPEHNHQPCPSRVPVSCQLPSVYPLYIMWYLVGRMTWAVLHTRSTPRGWTHIGMHRSILLVPFKIRADATTQTPGALMLTLFQAKVHIWTELQHFLLCFLWGRRSKCLCCFSISGRDSQAKNKTTTVQSGRVPVRTLFLKVDGTFIRRPYLNNTSAIRSGCRWLMPAARARSGNRMPVRGSG